MEEKPKKRLIRRVLLAVGVGAIIIGVSAEVEPETAMALIAGGFALLADVLASFGG